MMPHRMVVCIILCYMQTNCTRTLHPPLIQVPWSDVAATLCSCWSVSHTPTYSLLFLLMEVCHFCAINCSASQSKSPKFGDVSLTGWRSLHGLVVISNMILSVHVPSHALLPWPSLYRHNSCS